MSEPLGAVRVSSATRVDRVWAPHPAPVVAQRPAFPSEIPAAAMRFGRVAMASQWSVSAFYALGWGLDSRGRLTQRLRASVLLRMRRGDERAIGLWATPWPIPEGLAVPELPPLDLPRDGHVNVLRVLLAGQAEPPKPPEDVVVKWAFDTGCHWIRPAAPLVIGTGAGRNGWLRATELRAKVTGK